MPTGPKITDPALNLLHNAQVMQALRETQDKLTALGMSCNIVPGGPRTRDDEAMSVSLFVAPHDDALLDMRAADSMVADLIDTTEGNDLFHVYRASILAQEAQWAMLSKSVEWVLSQGVDARQSKEQWEMLVVKAAKLFEVDIEELNACLSEY